MSNTKLDPRSLTSEERAIVEDMVSRLPVSWGVLPSNLEGNPPYWLGYLMQPEWAQVYESAFARILARRAIFGDPASERVSGECEAMDSGYRCVKLAGHEGEHLACGLANGERHYWPKEPASEPAVFEVSPSGSVRIVSGDGSKWQSIPAGIVTSDYDLVQSSEPAKVECPNCGEMTSAPHSINPIGGHRKWYCARPEPTSEPAKVRMTPELERVLNYAASCQRWSDVLTVLDPKDIAAVRAQAAEAGEVRMPKVRSYFLSLSMLPEYRNGGGRAFLAEVKAEIDAAEGKGEGRG